MPRAGRGPRGRRSPAGARRPRGREPSAAAESARTAADTSWPPPARTATRPRSRRAPPPCAPHLAVGDPCPVCEQSVRVSARAGRRDRAVTPPTRRSPTPTQPDARAQQPDADTGRRRPPTCTARLARRHRSRGRARRRLDGQPDEAAIDSELARLDALTDAVSRRSAAAARRTHRTRGCPRPLPAAEADARPAERLHRRPGPPGSRSAPPPAVRTSLLQDWTALATLGRRQAAPAGRAATARRARGQPAALDGKRPTQRSPTLRRPPTHAARRAETATGAAAERGAKQARHCSPADSRACDKHSADAPSAEATRPRLRDRLGSRQPRRRRSSAARGPGRPETGQASLDALTERGSAAWRAAARGARPARAAGRAGPADRIRPRRLDGAARLGGDGGRQPDRSAARRAEGRDRRRRASRPAGAGPDRRR